MRRFLFIPLAALVGIGLAGLFRFFFPRESAPAPAPVSVSASAEQAKAEAAPSSPSARSVLASEPWPTGYVVVGARVTVQMSDGTTRIEHRPNAARTNRLGAGADHGEVSDIDRNAIVIEGKKLFMKPAPRPASSSAFVGAPPSEGAGAAGLSAR